MLYIVDSISFTVVDEYSVIDTDIECLVLRTKKTLISGLYRPPAENKYVFLKFFDTLLYFLSSTKLPFKIMGDINIDTISNDVYARDHNDQNLPYGCSNVISQPTRITSESATSIDVCVTNVNQTQLVSGIFSRDISDHLPIFCLSRVPIEQNKTDPGNYCYRKINDETLCTFQALVERFAWTTIYLEQSAETAFRKFSEEFRKICDLAFPAVKSRTVK